MTTNGLIAQRKNRITGTTISVYKAGPGNGLDNSGGDWITVCENHGNLINHRTRKLAFWHATVPDWCYNCGVEHFGYKPDDGFGPVA